VTSLLAHSSVGLLFLIIGDRASQQIAKSILGESAARNDVTTKYQVVCYLIHYIHCLYVVYMYILYVYTIFTIYTVCM